MNNKCHCATDLDFMLKYPKEYQRQMDVFMRGVDTAPPVPMEWVLRMMAWKTRCKHVETEIVYRENITEGDVVCWKEMCNKCGAIVTSGSGKWTPISVKGRTTTEKVI